MAAAAAGRDDGVTEKADTKVLMVGLYATAFSRVFLGAKNCHIAHAGS